MTDLEGLREKLGELKDALDTAITSSEAPVVQELQNAREHCDAIEMRFTVVDEHENPPEDPEE